MGNVERSVGASTRSHNRVAAIMAHTKRYSFRGVSRLAKDAGLSKSTVSHLVRGKVSPLYITVACLVKSLELETGRQLNCTEVFSEVGEYPTEHVCDLLACSGCLPDIVFSEDGSRIAALEGAKPGQWTGDVAEFPRKVKDEKK